MIAFLFLPIWKKEVLPTQESISVMKSTDKVKLNAFKVSYVKTDTLKDNNTVAQKLGETNTVYIGILAILSALVALYSIFQFKKRLLQIKLGFLNSLLLSAVLGTIFLGIKAGDDLLKDQGSEDFLVGFYLPIIALLLNLMANRYIKKDEALVRSVDRIR
jgi:hypothetical protein